MNPYDIIQMFIDAAIDFIPVAYQTDPVILFGIDLLILFLAKVLVWDILFFPVRYLYRVAKASIKAIS